MSWRFPLDAWEGCVPQGDHPGAFGVGRKHDVHTGVDLYVGHEAPVSAVEPGEVVSIENYTGPEAGSSWWRPTQAILVEGDSGVVCYGEVKPVDGLRSGDSVAKGQILAHVAPVLPKSKIRSDIPGHSNLMLHLELYRSGTIESVWWHLSQDRPPELLDPTPYLLEALAVPEFSEGGRLGMEFSVGRCRVVVQQVFRVEIQGYKPEKEPYDAKSDSLGLGPLPVAAQDDGLSQRLQQWMHQEAKILGALSGIERGLECYTGYFNEEMANSVVEWLEEQAAHKNQEG